MQTQAVPPLWQSTAVFAVGTAVGDWTLELTGWTLGTSVLFLGAIVVVVGYLTRAEKDRTEPARRGE